MVTRSSVHYRKINSPVRLKWWHNVDSTGLKIPNSEFPRLHLGIKWRNENAEWNVFMEMDGAIGCYLPGSGQYSKFKTVQIEFNTLEASYLFNTEGRSLTQDINNYGLASPERVPAHFKARNVYKFNKIVSLNLYVPKRSSRDEDNREVDFIHLDTLKNDNLVLRVLPPEMRDAGFQIDENWNAGSFYHINPVMKVLSPNGDAIYIKREENVAALRSEILSSLIWREISWPGVSSSTRVVGSDSLLVIPALGSLLTKDCGSFHSFFKYLPDENHESLLTRFPQNIKKLGLEDLNLIDEKDVIRFVLVNAITGNVDRHKGNIHYGMENTREGVSKGRILPIDHGISIFNNTRVPKSSISGTPADAICGTFGNPHQLIRPFSELVNQNITEAKLFANHYIEYLISVVNFLERDEYSKKFGNELKAINDRCTWLVSNFDDFILNIEKVVVK